MMQRITIIAILILCSILLLHVLPFFPIISYSATFMLSSLLYLYFAYELFKSELTSRTIFILIAISIVVRCSFLGTLPIGSDDIYRYMWDGKVQMNFINPYQFAPNDQGLHHLSSPIIPQLVNHPDMKTMYFPLSLWLFLVGYVVSGESVWGYKLLLLIFEVAALYGSILLLKKLRISEKFVLLYALCPMLFYEYAIDGHVDGFGMPLLIFSLYCYLSDKKIAGLILLGFCLSIKPTALILLPVFFAEEKEWKARLYILTIPILTLTAQFVPYFSTANPFDALTTFTRHWTFNGFVFNSLNLYFSDNKTTRIICAVLLGIVVLLIARSKRPFTEKAYNAILSLLLFSPIVHPWYVGWLAALLPAARKWSGIIFVATLSVTSFTYINYQLNGVWSESPAQWLVEYVPVAVFALRETFSNYGKDATLL